MTATGPRGYSCTPCTHTFQLPSEAREHRQSGPSPSLPEGTLLRPWAPNRLPAPSSITSSPSTRITRQLHEVIVRFLETSKTLGQWSKRKWPDWTGIVGFGSEMTGNVLVRQPALISICNKFTFRLKQHLNVMQRDNRRARSRALALRLSI